MCKFFSLVSKGDGKAMYFDDDKRKELRKNNPENYSVDSHTSIADYFGYKGEDEDKLNKYEYNPLTKKFIVDQLNTVDDSKKIKRFCNKLDFKTIVSELEIKKIIRPFEDINRKRVSKKDIELLKEWVKVINSAGGSVADCLWSCLWDTPGASIWDSVRETVGDSVRGSVASSVREVLRECVDYGVVDSMGGSVRDTVWNSISAYIGSFFNIEKWKHIKHKNVVYPFQSGADLWERGLVPFTDGKIWYLCGGKKSKILWKGKV